jgi:hypothetical protein
MGKVITSWQDVTIVYPELATLKDATSPERQASIIERAEAEVHGRLSVNFSTPFSSTNLTAKSLMIDMVYIQNVLSKQPVKGKTIKDYVDERIKALCNGTAQMVTVGGTIAQTASGDPVWSSTMMYHPTFGAGDERCMDVSSQMLIDENTARGDPSEEAV